MFTRLSISLALLVSALFAVAPARAHIAPPLLTFCAAGSGNGDGCMQAPQAGLNSTTSGWFQLPNCWTNGGSINQYSGTKTSYSTTGNSPQTLAAGPYNDPGCAYPLGPTTPVSQLKDIALSQPAGCTYSLAHVNAAGNPILDCTALQAPWIISGYDFSANANHPCVAVGIFVVAGSPTDVYFTNNRIVNDGQCSINGTSNFMIDWVGTNYTAHFLDNYVDGNSQVWRTSYGSCQFGGTLACNGSQALAIGNGLSADVQYNVFKNFAGRPLAIKTTTTTGDNIVVSHNLGLCWDTDNGLNHGEFILPAPGLNSGLEVFAYDNFIMCTNGDGDNDAIVPTINGGATGATVSDFVYDHNPSILSWWGGATGGTITAATIPAGTSTLVITGQTGSIGSGMVVSCGSVTGATIKTPYSGQTSAGPGGGYNSSSPGSWGLDITSPTFPTAIGYIDNGSGSAGNVLHITTAAAINVIAGTGGLQGTNISGTGITAATITADGTGSGGVGTYTINGAAQLVGSVGSPVSITTAVPNPYDTGWSVVSTQTCSSQSPGTGGQANAVGMDVNLMYYTASQITDNLLDTSSIPGFSPWGQTGGTTISPGPSCAVATTFGGNVDAAGLISNANQWFHTISGSGC